MTRLRLVKAPPAAKPAPKPVYARVPLYGAVTVDRRAEWTAKRDAAESERLRAVSVAQSQERKA